MTFDLKYEENGKEKVIKIKTISFIGNVLLVNVIISIAFYAALALFMGILMW